MQETVVDSKVSSLLQLPLPEICSQPLEMLDLPDVKVVRSLPALFLTTMSFCKECFT